MFEYKIINLTNGPVFDTVQKLNELGLDGWELVQVRENTKTSKPDYIFKRKINKSEILINS